MLRRRHAWAIAAVLIGLGGVAVRAHALGRRGFSTDEAWVALLTRVHGADQLWLSLGVSPLGSTTSGASPSHAGHPGPFCS